MPFKLKRYEAKCANMSADELQREREHYTRLISTSATLTAVSTAAVPFTHGVSVIGGRQLVKFSGRSDQPPQVSARSYMFEFGWDTDMSNPFSIVLQKCGNSNSWHQDHYLFEHNLFICGRLGNSHNLAPIVAQQYRALRRKRAWKTMGLQATGISEE